MRANTCTSWSTPLNQSKTRFPVIADSAIDDAGWMNTGEFKICQISIEELGLDKE